MSLNFIKEKIKEYTKDPLILDRIDKIAFFISLIPVKGIKEIAALISKIAQDKSFGIKMDNIFNEISSINKNLGLLNGITEEQAREIKQTINVVTNLRDKLDALIRDIVKKVQEGSSCVIITKDWSLQNVLNSNFEGDNYSVDTEDHSEVVLSGVAIKAKQSVFKATNHSKNTLESVNCQGTSGAVGFEKIIQEGECKTEDASITLKHGASLTFYQKK